MELFNLKSVDGISLEAAIHKAQTKFPIGTVIQAHGITADMDESGMFVRLAGRLANAGFDVIRFSFRGHGKSGGTQRGTTIAGELLDLQAVVDYTEEVFCKPFSIIAASFGAVSTCLSLRYLEKRLKGVVLLNPVLDLQKTFIHPELPWGKMNFNAQSVKQLMSQGYFLLDGEFEIGRVLYEEWRYFKPYEFFIASATPSIIIHGDKDTYVPYEVSKVMCQRHQNCKLFTIKDSDHGFEKREHADEAIDITIDWIKSIYG